MNKIVISNLPPFLLKDKRGCVNLTNLRTSIEIEENEIARVGCTSVREYFDKHLREHLCFTEPVYWNSLTIEVFPLDNHPSREQLFVAECLLKTFDRYTDKQEFNRRIAQAMYDRGKEDIRVIVIPINRVTHNFERDLYYLSRLLNPEEQEGGVYER